MRSKIFVGSVLVSLAVVACGGQENGGTSGTGGQSASGGSARFQARGLATGTVVYLSGSGRSVNYR